MDIINDVIREDFPELILDFYPKAFWDTFPKELLAACPEGLVSTDIFSFHFKQKLNNEFYSREKNKFISDSPFLTFEKIIIGLEFQSEKIDYKKETIFNIYQAGLHKEHQKCVLTVVFSMVDDEHRLIKHKVGLSDEFTILIISLNALNQKQTLNNSLYKINNNLDMSFKEKVLFFSSPLMDEGNAVEAINIISGAFYRIRNASESERIEMRNIILLYLGKWCPQGFLDDEGDDMVVLTPEAKRIKEKLMEEGIGKAIYAVNMVNGGSSLDDASKATGLSKTQIAQLCPSSR